MSDEKKESKTPNGSMHPPEVTQPAFEPDETFVEGLSFHGLGGFCAAAVDVKNGRILRIRPLHYDWKYKPEELYPGRWR